LVAAGFFAAAGFLAGAGFFASVVALGAAISVPFLKRDFHVSLLER
jgi:hypothetical protein